MSPIHFYGLYLITDTSSASVKEVLDSSFYVVNHDFDSFSKRWFESEIKFPSSVVGDPSDGSLSPSPPHSLASSLKAGHSYYMGFEHTEDTYSKRGREGVGRREGEGVV